MENNQNIRTTRKRSLIEKYFDKETYLDIIRIIKIPNADNNDKGVLIKNLLKEKGIPFSALGQGTNRMAVLIDGYAVKIALDQDGAIDNRREILYTKKLQPYVIKVYECIPDGLIAVSEYVRYFSVDDYHSHKEEMREILASISENYLIGDCGITGKNYINWGTRNDGTICILDFAYIYDTKFSVFSCSCMDGVYLQYDSNYVNLICPVCGRKYTFQELRRRITKAQQEDEIGDIRRLSYNLTKPEEDVEYKADFEPQKKRKKKKDKELSETELLIKQYLESQKTNNIDEDDYWNS